MPDPSPNEFERLATEERRPSALGEIWEFLSVNKKWWLLPIVLALGFMGVLIALSTGPAAPFIYTLF